MTLILSRSDVERIVATSGARVLNDVIDRIEAGYVEMANGVMQQHSRIYLRGPKDPQRRPPGLFTMSALLPDSGFMGTRLLGLGGGDRSEGVLVLFEYGTNKLLAIMDDPLLHRYRTGAPFGLASKYLARPESRVVGCIGSGSMGRGGLAMVCAAMPSIREARVYSPTESHRVAFAEEMSAMLGIPVRAVDSAAAAVDGVDIINTATDVDRPVVSDRDIPDGCHINLIARNEIEMATVRRSKVVSASNQALRELDPPLHEPIPEEIIHCEISELAAKRAVGRTSDREITVFVGVTPLAMWDVAAAAAFHQAGRELGVGATVNISQ